VTREHRPRGPQWISEHRIRQMLQAGELESRRADRDGALEDTAERGSCAPRAEAGAGAAPGWPGERPGAQTRGALEGVRALRGPSRTYGAGGEAACEKNGASSKRSWKRRGRSASTLRSNGERPVRVFGEGYAEAVR
jgi:hypothetical protein